MNSSVTYCLLRSMHWALLTQYDSYVQWHERAACQFSFEQHTNTTKRNVRSNRNCRCTLIHTSAQCKVRHHLFSRTVLLWLILHTYALTSNQGMRECIRLHMIHCCVVFFFLLLLLTAVGVIWNNVEKFSDTKSMSISTFQAICVPRMTFNLVFGGKKHTHTRNDMDPFRLCETMERVQWTKNLLFEQMDNSLWTTTQNDFHKIENVWQHTHWCVVLYS